MVTYKWVIFMRKLMILFLSLVLLAGCQRTNDEPDETLVTGEAASLSGSEETSISYQQEFEDYKQENEDVIGYLVIENSGIETVVMNSDYYLYKDLQGQFISYGLPFIDSSELDEGNLIIYGHNSYLEKDAPFHNVRNYIDVENYIDNHHRIYFYSEENQQEIYEIFAVCRMPADDEYFKYYQYTFFESESDYLLFCSQVRRYQEFSIDQMLPDIDQKILMISTCANCVKYSRDTAQRIVIFAKLVEN